MLEDNGSDSEELQEQTRPFKAKISSIIWSYSLICGAVVLLAGYAALVGTLAEELSKQIIWLLSITLAFHSWSCTVGRSPCYSVTRICNEKGFKRCPAKRGRVGWGHRSTLVHSPFAFILNSRCHNITTVKHWSIFDRRRRNTISTPNDVIGLCRCFLWDFRRVEE